MSETEVQEEKTGTGIDVQEKLDKAELFLDKNRKQVLYIAGAIAAVIGLIALYKYWYIPQKESEAQAELFYAEQLFEKDSFNLAINGGYKVKSNDGMEKTVMSLAEIADQYSGTPSGNLANYYLGISYLQTGKFNEAVEYLSKFESDDVVLNAVAVGATGDAYVELQKLDEAVKYYLKAADQNENSFTSPLYLKKAGLVYETKGNFADAVKIYERIQKEYNKSTEARDIEKLIARAKAAGNL